jgi:hypothetical protein
MGEKPSKEGHNPRKSLSIHLKDGSVLDVEVDSETGTCGWLISEVIRITGDHEIAALETST